MAAPVTGVSPPDEDRRPGTETGAANALDGTNTDSVRPHHDHLADRDDSAVYRPRPVKRRRSTRADLERIDEAIVAAVEADHPVTLRGVYYRAVSAGAIEKTEAAYKLVGRQLLKLRRAGKVPYSHITDGSRLMMRPDTWASAEQLLRSTAKTYRRSLWTHSDVEVIVLSEKDAISGVVHPITDAWDVELGITRGYSSETFTHSIAETVVRNALGVKATIIYQLGDHDPSGVDAWRDFQTKVRGFAHDIGNKYDIAQTANMMLLDLTFERLAVTPRQIVEYDLPTRPTKKSDTRSAKFDGGSVEVDAIPASTLRVIVEEAITQHLDQQHLDVVEMVEAEERAGLEAMARGWSA